ncbi:MAG: DUF1836 domain-containing protein [Oscillospiraceae bacterium]|nr:DUF1836 domain-containing protein [Oscillospiraceae bacterium]
MKQETKQQIADSIKDFRLPRYNEIPNVGLYLEQATKYVGEYLAPLGEYTLTPSMISNYVKKGLIANPVKKQYGREHIAYLFFIAVAKSVLSLDALTGFIKLQQQTYTLPKAYDYFAGELENLLQFTFELKDTMEMVGEDNTDEKRLLYTCIVAAVQKVYLEKCLEAIAREED